MNDIDSIVQLIDNQEVISVSEPVYSKWNLQAYLMRFYGVATTTKDTNEFLLIQPNETAPAEYKKIPISLNNFAMYQKLESE